MKLTKKEYDNLHKGEHYCDDRTLMYRKYIMSQMTPELKDPFYRRIIKELLESKDNENMMGFANKYYCELLYSNHIINKFIEKYKTELPKLEVRPSKIHGNGLFAKESIERDHFITFYPMHYVSEDSGKTYISNELVKSGHDMTSFDFDPRKYMLTGAEKELFNIGGHPKLYTDHQNGHIANYNRKENAYFGLVRDKNNMSNIWMLISTKFIDTDDEILVDYGPRTAGIIG